MHVDIDYNLSLNKHKSSGNAELIFITLITVSLVLFTNSQSLSSHFIIRIDKTCSFSFQAPHFISLLGTKFPSF